MGFHDVHIGVRDRELLGCSGILRRPEVDQMEFRFAEDSPDSREQQGMKSEQRDRPAGKRN
jgi:hypothetical protein